MDITIRLADHNDIDWLIIQAKAFSAFNSTAYPLFESDEYARSGMQMLMDKHFMRIADRGEERLGFIAAYYTQHPLNPALIVLCELMWWVAEEHRGSSAGLRLLNAYTEWGKEHANWVTFCLQHHSPVKEESLTKRGYRLHEKSYLLEVC